MLQDKWRCQEPWANQEHRDRRSRQSVVNLGSPLRAVAYLAVVPNGNRSVAMEWPEVQAEPPHPINLDQVSSAITDEQILCQGSAPAAELVVVCFHVNQRDTS
jgi:hypothetical protein